MGTTSKNAEGGRPNIVLILADDLGWGDIGAYGAEICTPWLDRLAAGGLRFTQMYNAGRCCPTRASLLTGLYPHQAGVGHMVVDLGVPAYQGYLNDRCVTLAEVLKGAGYRTLMAGKWHVGGEQANLPPDWYPDKPGYPTPQGRGFDRFYGILSGGGSYFNPNMLLDGVTRMAVDTPQYHFTDAISQRAADFVEDAAHRDQPFFLYLAYTAPHWPLHAWAEDIARYRGRYLGGWDRLRATRHEEQRGLGLVDRAWAIAPRDAGVTPWERAGQRQWRDLQMAVYAAQVEQMDRGIGQVVRALEDQGVAEDTLVLFLSDNGGCAEFLQEDGEAPDPSRYVHPTVDGRLVRVGNTPAIEPGPADSFASVDIGWAHASNAPFRLFKRYTHEGGIATPFIAHWPRGIGRAGLVHGPTHVVDVMPTLAEVAGARYPGTCQGRDILPLPGESFAAALRGGEWQRQSPLFWEHEGNRAVRLGDWKLVSEVADPSDPASQAVWELYHMGEDRTELRNLAEREKGRTAALIELYNNWAERCGVLPWPIPASPRPLGMEVLSRHNHSVQVPSVRLGPNRRQASGGQGIG